MMKSLWGISERTCSKHLKSQGVWLIQTPEVLPIFRESMGFFLHHLLQPLSFDQHFPHPRSKTPLPSSFLYVFQNPGSSTNQFMHHLYHRTGWTSPQLQRHFLQDPHCPWTKCTLKGIRPSRTGEILIPSLPGPSWEAAELSNDPIWKNEKKGGNKLLFHRREWTQRNRYNLG